MRSDIVPLENISSPQSVSLLGQVHDDWQAVEVWLQLLRDRESSPATLATYEREYRRIRWYCETRKTSPLRSWSYQDVSAYKSFLVDHASDHPCPRGLRPNQAGWTPFRAGQLSTVSVNAALRVMNSLFRFWHQAGYVAGNPFSQSIARQKTAPAHSSRRAVPIDLLEFVRTTLHRRPKKTAIDHLTYWRDVFVLLLLERTALRANEAAQADMVDIHQIAHPQRMTMYWALRIRHQKGGGEGLVALDADVMQALRDYRIAFGLTPEPAANESYPLVLSPKTAAALDARPFKSARSRRSNMQWRPARTRQAVWGIVRRAFNTAAEAAGPESQEAALLQKASTHWLRHTAGTALTLKGNELRAVAAFMRHRDPRTTMGYTNLEFFDIIDALDANQPK